MTIKDILVGLATREADPARDYALKMAGHYRAQVTEQEVKRSVLARVTEGLFKGDVTALVHQLLEHDQVSAADLAQVKRLIEARETKPNR